MEHLRRQWKEARGEPQRRVRIEPEIHPSIVGEVPSDVLEERWADLVLAVTEDVDDFEHRIHFAVAVAELMAIEKELVLRGVLPEALRQTIGVRYEMQPSKLPPEPGTSSIPSGMVRLYHYTRPENIESILRDGLKQSSSRGETYGEPNVVWASAEMPDHDHAFVEFYADPDTDLDIGSGTPASVLEQRKSNVTMRGDVAPNRIVSYNEPWMGTARYALENDMTDAIRRGEYDSSVAGTEHEQRAIDWIKKHGFLTEGDYARPSKTKSKPDTRGGDRHRKDRTSAWARGYNTEYYKAREKELKPGAKCHWCGKPATETDHLKPRSKETENTRKNLVPSCSWCNRSRGGGQNRRRKESALEGQDVEFEVVKNIAMGGVTRGGRQLVIKVGGKWAGQITYKEISPTAAHIGMISVASGFRRQRVATWLMEKFHSMYRFVSVTPWTEDGASFWQSYKAEHPGVDEPSVGYISSLRTAALSNTDRVYVIEGLWEQSGIGSRKLHTQDELDAMVRHYAPGTRAVMTDNLTVHGGPEAEGALGLCTPMGTVVVLPGVSEFTVLHEIAHSLNPERFSDPDPHGEGFLRTARGLYERAFGKGDDWWDLTHPGKKTAGVYDDRLGRCYELAADRVAYAGGEADEVLVHGSIEGEGQPRLAHAWAQRPNGDVWEPITQTSFDAVAWKLFAKPEVYLTYTSEEVLKVLRRSGHWGPWDAAASPSHVRHAVLEGSWEDRGNGMHELGDYIIQGDQENPYHGNNRVRYVSWGLYRRGESEPIGVYRTLDKAKSAAEKLP
jgi:5-methylcytosine-specific restriction endonuclease McrA